MSKAIAIIPARGGSKRIPRKNIREFLGKPIIAYSIEAALKSSLFDEVVVSTDDEEIAEVAKRYGANIPFFRSAKNSDDDAILNDVLEEVIKKYDSLGKKYDIGCCILPTAPFITKDNLQKGYNILIQNSFDSVRPVVRFSYPIQKALKLDEKGQMEMWYPEFYTTRSQDLEVVYHDAGQFYWFRNPALLKSNNKGAFEIAEMDFQDIDTPDDWVIAELKMKILNELAKNKN